LSEKSLDRALPSTVPDPGSRIVIVGAGGGVGKAATAACVKLGLRLALLDLPAVVEAMEVPPGATAVAVDAADANSTQQAFATAASSLGGIDHLFHLAGFSTIPPRPLKEIGIDEWDRVIEGNLRSAYLCASAAMRSMDGDSCSIVFVSSTMTAAPSKGYGTYVAAKSGTVGLMKALAVESAPRVRVNAVAPSAMLTAFMGGGPQASQAGAGKWDWFDPVAAAAAIPMGRLCTPRDVVGPLLFLSSAAASFITGQVLHVSGGRVMP
jgi:NAD(P)-dependent dehydrogenase (short-subunit alcohol dehydrogenase family)